MTAEKIVSKPTELKITPFDTPAGFGCEVTGVDLNELSEEDFKKLEEALYVYKIVIVRDQHNLKPESQYQLCRRFDPASPGGHGHGNAKDVLTRNLKDRSSLSAEISADKPITGGTPSHPDNDNVRIIGYGTFPAGTSGFEEPFTLSGLSHRGFHKDPMSQEEMDQGFTRWHFFKSWPARVTTFWPHTLPKAADGSTPTITVKYDDGSEQTTPAPIGKTAFFDCARMFDQLTPEQKEWCKNTVVEYPPSPYSWIIDCGATSDAFGLFSEGKEQSFDELPPYDEADIQRLPLCWPNPVTGELALQCHAILAYKLHTTVDGVTTTIDDLPTIRKILRDLQRPYLKTENILFSDQKEGDFAVWYNRGLRHSAVEYPTEKYGPRLAHQCHIVGSDDPSKPTPIEGIPLRARA
ncbi:hypothetical protein MNV49_006001 [Pseudohyphozyma bogoriensis]|nr:hypothetical protein MNV49_006001 [Pseudohyphozyma bogoriensis]